MSVREDPGARHPETGGDGSAGGDGLVLRRADVELVALLTVARLPDPEAERRRLALLDGVHRSGHQASQALATLTRRGISESRGSHSAWNLGEDAALFLERFAEYAAQIRSAATMFREVAPAMTDATERARTPKPSGG